MQDLENLNKQKITVVHSNYIWQAQTQTWLYHQIRNLPDEIESHIVCEKTENLDQFWLPNIHSLDQASQWRRFIDKRLRRFGIWTHLRLLVEVAKRHHAKIIHSHFGNMAWMNLKAVKQLKIKHVVTFYGCDVNFLPQQDSRWRTRYQELFAQTDLFLCEGSHMAQCLINMGCPADKIKVHHLGVKIEQISFQPRVWHQDEPLKVLITGTFTEKKGIPYALEALGKLQSQIPLEITIIGDARDTERMQIEKAKILNTINKYNLQSKVKMLGYQTHQVFFEQAYQHHIFISPSVTAKDGDTEGGAPVAIIELAATGMPILSTTHCDISEVIIDGVTGLLTKERNVDGLVKNLQKLVDYPQMWEQMTRAGREHVEKEYNALIQGQNLAKIYQSLLS